MNEIKADKKSASKIDNKELLSLAEQVEKKPPRLNLRVIWFFISPYKIFFLLLILLSILIGLTETLNIAILYPIANYALNIPSTNTSNLFNIIERISSLSPFEDKVVNLSLLFSLIAILSFLGGILYVLLTNKIISRMTIDNKVKIFSKYNNLDYQFFTDNKQGDLLYQAYRAPGFITEAFLTLTKFIVDVVLSITIFLLLLSLSVLGTFIITSIGLIYFLLSRYLSRKVSYTTGTGRYQAGQKELAVLNEYISGVKIIKASETASYWKKNFEDAIGTYWRLWRKDNFWLQTSGLSFSFIVYSLVAIVIIFVRISYGSDFIPIIPGVITFTFAAFRLLPKISSFGGSVMHIMGVLPNLEIVSHLLKDSSYTTIKSGGKPFIRLDREIIFKNIQFTHKNRDNTLKDITFGIAKNKVTAIVGPSGSGKSTIVDLLLRLYDVNQGEITIDGTDIKHYDITSLRRRIGFVSQEPFIYNATVKDNIIFGDEYNNERIIEAAKLASAHDFISELPQGYDTLLGDRGVKLSGGEKQRIAIARAMIRKPEILILDEATSFLDYISELAVQKAIDRVSTNTTTLIIAHRLSTIQNADIIYVLDEGKIVEQGTSLQLLQKKGKYWELYNAQSRPSMTA